MLLRREISKGWTVKEKSPQSAEECLLLPVLKAQVPGNIHLDLMREGVISNPFEKMFEKSARWIDELDWVYETDFYVESVDTQNSYLVFHGLDTLAEIRLNGDPLGSTDNMFIPHEFSVRGKIRAGEGDEGKNTLSVTLRSTIPEGRARHKEWLSSDDNSLPYSWGLFEPRAFVRKAQYMYGWDWGPTLPSCGIWQPVELVHAPVARLLDWRYETTFQDSEKAQVLFEMAFERAIEHKDTPLKLQIAFPNGETSTVVVDAPTGEGRLLASASLIIEDVKRWQPNGRGEASLYDIEISIIGQEIEDKIDASIGFRRIELIREPDPDGKGMGFKFRVNGIDTFAKGANWIPSHSFPTIEIVEDNLKAAKEAGYNMLRVWGGGLYESEKFYRLCDKYGIMVWQDFPYACGYYPDTDEYAKAARIEATAAVRRIRNHPSLALWCGNNENNMMHHDGWGGYTPKRFYGEHLYFEILPEVVITEDPGRAYTPSSPFGGENPNAENFGDQHNWDVWHGRGDWKFYAENRSRFASEFGFASSCGLAAWDLVLKGEKADAQSGIVRWHDKTRKGYDTYLNMVALHFPPPSTLEELVYYTQLNQAEALKFGIEHYRCLKGECWGTLIWQINDCWPVQSWSMIDFNGEEKASYYASKQFYAAQLISLVKSGNHVEAYLVNDDLAPVQGNVKITVQKFDGAILQKTSNPANVAANSVEIAASMDLELSEDKLTDCFVRAVFEPDKETDNIEQISNALFFAEPKDFKISSPLISTTVSSENDSQITIELQSDSFAPYVWIRALDHQTLKLSDNYFHLFPRESRLVTIKKPANIEGKEIASWLSVTSFNSKK